MDFRKEKLDADIWFVFNCQIYGKHLLDLVGYQREGRRIKT